MAADDGSFDGETELRPMAPDGVCRCQEELSFIDAFKRGVQPRQINGFPGAFVGTRAVDWLLENSKCKTRKQAEVLGLRLFHAGVIQHVARELFSDSPELYQFREEFTPIKDIKHDAGCPYVAEGGALAQPEPDFEGAGDDSGKGKHAAALKGRVMFVSVGGTRGDIQPYLALGVRMIEAGYAVGMVCFEQYRAWLERHGISVYPIEGDIAGLMQSDEFKHAFYDGGLRDQMKVAQAHHTRTMRSNMDLTLAGVEAFRPDVLIANPAAISECLAMGQARCIPVLSAMPIPYWPSTTVCPLIGPFKYEWITRAAQWAGFKAIWMMLGAPSNDFRQTRLHLPSQKTYQYRCIPELNCFSDITVPRPPDWPEHVENTGYWILPAGDYAPPQELADFLAAGEKPIFMGFGSMPLRDVNALYRMFARVCARLGHRGLFQGGANVVDEAVAMATEDVPSPVMVIKDCPHEWLFPRCAAVFTHGGAGSVAATLRAGCPTIVCPLLADQPFWGRQVAALGCGPQKVVPLKDISEESIEEAITAALTPEIRDAAERVGARLRAEDGCAKGLEAFERYFNAMRMPRPIIPTFVDEKSIASCQDCHTAFGFSTWRHRCMSCGNIFCSDCVEAGPLMNYDDPQEMCFTCWKRRTQRPLSAFPLVWL